MAGYSKKSLVDKLGAKKGVLAVVINPPEGFNLDGVKVLNKLNSPSDFILLFTKSKGELNKYFPKLKSHLKSSGLLWISWPKKTSKVKTDLDENEVMKIGLENGLVDVKIAAISEVWSGLKFVYRLKDRKQVLISSIRWSQLAPNIPSWVVMYVYT